MRTAAVVLAIFMAQLFAAEEVTFAVRRAVSDQTEREELAAVELDREVYGLTRDGFPDLRVHAADDQAVPFLLQRYSRASSVWTERAEPARRIDDLVPDAEGNRIEVIVEPPQQEPSRQEAPAWIELVSPIRDFEKRVSVYRPAPGGAWQALTENQCIYDYSRFMDVRRCRIPLPPAPAAERYRLVISEVTESAASAFVELTTRSGGAKPDEETVRRVLHRRDFRIDRIDFGYRVREERRDVPVWADYPLAITATEHDEKEGVTRLTVDAGRLPIAALRFAIADRNVSRGVYVEVQRSLDDGTFQWQRLGQGTLRLLDFRDVQEEALTVSLAETRAKELRVVLVDQDSAPLTVQGITAVCPVYRVLFLARPGTAYQLLYGSRSAPAPRYDTAGLQQIADRKDREVRTLRLQAPGDVVAYPRENSLLRLLNSRTTLWVVLGLAVVVLGLATLSAARRISRTEPPAPPPAAGA
jgi:hypothetical protein